MIRNLGFLFYTLTSHLIPLCPVMHIVPALAAGSSFSWLLYPFDIPLIFSLHFLLSDTNRCSRFVLYIPCPSPRISHFSREPPLRCWIWRWKRTLSAGNAHCHSGLLLLGRQLTEHGVRTPTLGYTYDDKYFHICPPVSVSNLFNFHAINEAENIPLPSPTPPS